MKITAFLGSPRAGGNTDLLAEQVLRGASDAGFETETVALRKLRVRPCTGCDKCWQSARPCIFNDDMSVLYETIGESDILLFATPVYWYAPTAIFKAFIDRLIPLNRPQGWHLIENKAAILVTAYEEDGTTAAEPMLRMFELSLEYLRITFLDSLVAGGVGPKGAVAERPDILARAYEMGRNLSRSR